MREIKKGKFSEVALMADQAHSEDEYLETTIPELPTERGEVGDSELSPLMQEKKSSPQNRYSNLKIGEILLKEGLIDKNKLQKALEIQKEEKELEPLPLGTIMIRKGLLSDSQIKRLLAHPEMRKKIGDMAVAQGLVEREKLEEALSTNSQNMHVGELMVRRELITSRHLQKLLQEQANSNDIVELAAKLGLISKKDVEHVIRIKNSPRLLGEILCDEGLVNPLDFSTVMKRYGKALDFGEIALREGLVAKEQLNSVLKEVGDGTDSLADILIRKGIMDQDQFLTTLAKQHGIQYMPLEGFTYDKKSKEILSTTINQKYAEKNRIIPLSLNNKKLTFGIHRIESLETIKEVKKLYHHLDIFCVLIPEPKYKELFEALYNLTPMGIHGKPLDMLNQGDETFEIDLQERIEETEEQSSPYYAKKKDVEAEEIVNFLIKYAILYKASDIHIEQDRGGAGVRFRIDGLLQEPNIPWLKQKIKEKMASVISRIKVLANLDISERRLPQDGVFRMNYFDTSTNEKFDLDFRVATCKAIVGENITIRILDSRKANIGLDDINHSPHVVEPLKDILKSTTGIILVTGPTGSGKTSTLYALLKHINDKGIKIITAEDPIEYSFPGIMQTQIQPKIGLTFSRLLRSFLRFDPDVILVGEMRDEETAKIGFEAAQTGHLLLSTLHTNDAISSIKRLLDLNVDYGQMAVSLKAIMAQRLIRTICPECIEEYQPETNEWELLFDNYPDYIQFYRGVGCEKCFFTGYKGRTVVSEMFVVNKEISSRLSKGTHADDLLKMARESGMKTMLEDGLSKLHQTTMNEILRVIPLDMTKIYKETRKSQDFADLLLEMRDSGEDISTIAEQAYTEELTMGL